ncbi:D-alanyl-D-alanine carboxypeptidase [Methylomonas sp. LL1]|nr:D-alanyl-D-alanine carboxypeptidase [Methylomonas sp. LL1]
MAYLLFYGADASARYAAIVIDADSGRVVHEVESNQRWYPASLTKVMTIYMTFAALEAGRLQLHEQLTVSAHAARQPSSRLGLRRGQTISVEQAIMAVTTRSANDAAVLLAERLGGTESDFASMMTQQAHGMGMYNSSFQNASGLPDEGQISSARDLALLSAALIRDFPQYYRYFSATEFAYKGRVLPNTNKILKTYPDADGLKTGFTCGSGYNLIASAKRDGRRLIGVLLGAHSSGERFHQMGNLLDLGFEKSQAGVFGMPVEQLTNSNFAPPPFQLSSNRCAGSAEQMGADSGSGKAEAIEINPGSSGRSAERHAAKTRNHRSHASADNWAVMLGDHSRRTDANVDLKQARYALGSAAKGGEPHIVRLRMKGRQFWRAEWTALDQDQARTFCKKLRSKGRECTLLPG